MTPLQNSTEPNILFLGGMFPEEAEEWIRHNSKGNVHNAANVMQWNLLRGLRHHLGSALHVVSSPFVGSFPKFFRKLLLPSFQFTIDRQPVGHSAGFLNLPLVKHVSRYLSVQPRLRSAVESATPPIAVVAYSFTSVMAHALKRAKRYDPSVITCLVVADLPEYMNLQAHKPRLSSMLAKYTLNRLYKTLEYVDCVVVLTEPMVAKMGFTKPHVVIEGISEAPRANDTSPTAHDSTAAEQVVLYTGGLNEAFGVLNLVKAFITLPDPSLRLVLCGAGDAVDEIKDYAARDDRIVYKGLVSREEVIALQHQATVLVNPRQNTGEYVKYSFPSKLMEYMASGTPVVAYPLAGVPQDYREYFYLVPDHEIDSLASTIQRVLATPGEERSRIGQRARDFVLQEKSPEVQTAKILQMISDITAQREASYDRV